MDESTDEGQRPKKKAKLKIAPVSAGEAEACPFGWNALLREIQLGVFSYLDCQDICSMRSTSTRLKEQANDVLLARSIAETVIPVGIASRSPMRRIRATLRCGRTHTIYNDLLEDVVKDTSPSHQLTIDETEGAKQDLQANKVAYVTRPTTEYGGKAWRFQLDFQRPVSVGCGFEMWDDLVEKMDLPTRSEHWVYAKHDNLDSFSLYDEVPGSKPLGGSILTKFPQTLFGFLINANAPNKLWMTLIKRERRNPGGPPFKTHELHEETILQFLINEQKYQLRIMVWQKRLTDTRGFLTEAGSTFAADWK